MDSWQGLLPDGMPVIGGQDIDWRVDPAGGGGGVGVDYSTILAPVGEGRLAPFLQSHPSLPFWRLRQKFI